MYRIKLTNGDILQFDSLEALTGAIHAGAISDDALIFHQRSEQWLPVSVHPHYKTALATKAPAPPKAPIRELRPLRPLAPRPVAVTAANGTAGSVRSAAASSAALPSIDIDNLEESLELLGPNEIPAPAPGPMAPAPAPRVAPAAKAPRPAAVVPAAPMAPAAPIVESAPVVEAAAPVVVPVTPLVVEQVPEIEAPIAMLAAEPVAPTLVEQMPASMAEQLVSSQPIPMIDHAFAMAAPMIIPLGEMEAVPARSQALLVGADNPGLTTTAADDEVSFVELTSSPSSTADEEFSLASLAASQEATTPRRRSPLPYVAAAAMVIGAGATIFVMRPRTSSPAPRPLATPVSGSRAPVPTSLVPPVGDAAAGAPLVVPPAREPAVTLTPMSAPIEPAKPSVDERAAEAATKANDRDKTAREKARADSLKEAASRGNLVAAPQLGNLSGGTDVRTDISPAVLAARYAAAHEDAWGDLVTKLKVSGFDQVFTAARLAPSGASATRATIVSARASIGAFRTREGTIEKAYRDSAAGLVANGAWDAQEQKEWDAKPRRGESGELVGQANALLGSLERLYGVLATNSQAYSLTANGIAFTDGGAQREYWELRRTLLAQLTAAADAPAQSPLLLLVRAIGSGRPPESVATQ